MATYRKVRTSILIVETVAVIIIIIAIAIHPLHARIILGVENFVNNKYNELSNSKRVGIIANPTSLLPKTLNHIVDVMHDDMLQGNLKVEELIVFGPEHGFRGAAEAGHGGKSKYLDPQTNLTVYNTYGKNSTELIQMIKTTKVDTIIFDIQDVGARFYTFIWTMYDMMCAASSSMVSSKIQFIVLDRPNPLGGEKIHGPMILSSQYFSGVGKVNIPIQHGMTVGELALYFYSNAMDRCPTAFLSSSSSTSTIGQNNNNNNNNKRFINDKKKNNLNVYVVQMTNWDVQKTYPITEIPFVLPSPNMPTIETAFAYPGICFLEGTTLSEGRGTTKPFQIIGAPYLNYTFSQHLKSLIQNTDNNYCGIAIRDAYFTPTFSKFQGNISNGIDIYVTDPNCFDPFRLVLDILFLAQSMAGKKTSSNLAMKFEEKMIVNDDNAESKSKEVVDFYFLDNNFIDLLTGSNFTRLAILDTGRKWTTDLILQQYNDELIHSDFYKDYQHSLLYKRKIKI